MPLSERESFNKSHPFHLPAGQIYFFCSFYFTGRQFYTCAQSQGSGCDFFLWADNTADQGGGVGGPNTGYVGSNTYNGGRPNNSSSQASR